MEGGEDGWRAWVERVVEGVGEDGGWRVKMGGEVGGGGG